MVTVVLEHALPAGTYQFIPVLEEAPTPELPGQVIVFSQRDPRWSHLHMGGTAQTVGGMGCAMIVAAMILSRARQDITPAEFVSRLNAKGGFNIYQGEAHLAWDRLPSIYPELEWRGRKTWRRLLYKEELRQIFEIIDTEPLALWVDFRPTTSALNTHFVLGLDHDDTDIEIADPWHGDRCGLLERYALPGQTLERAIWGYRWLRVRSDSYAV